MIDNTLDQTAEQSISRCLKLRNRAIKRMEGGDAVCVLSCIKQFAEFIEARGDFREFRPLA